MNRNKKFDYRSELELNCTICGSIVDEKDKYCSKCGAALNPGNVSFIITTTPSIQGYKIKKVFGVVTGLTPRTRGVLGKFIGGIQSMLGGEVTAFTTELEKARLEAIERVRFKAISMGANAIVGLDMETSDLGLKTGIVVISATGTAVFVEPELLEANKFE
jgi:uncharacterized protein YbjQ (UPF0145 family)